MRFTYTDEHYSSNAVEVLSLLPLPRVGIINRPVHPFFFQS